jgi:uncharacterized membrane protein YtjA (UPF0391 family)
MRRAAGLVTGDSRNRTAQSAVSALFSPISHLARQVLYSLAGGEIKVLHYSIVFLIIALVAAFLGFGGIAGAAAGIAKILFFVFLVVFVISLLMGRRSAV